MTLRTRLKTTPHLRRFAKVCCGVVRNAVTQCCEKRTFVRSRIKPFASCMLLSTLSLGAAAQESVLATTPPLLVKVPEAFQVPALESIPSASAVENQIAEALKVPVQTAPMTAAECVEKAADASVKATLLELEMSLLDEPPKRHFHRRRPDPKKDLKRRILYGVARSAREDAALMSLEVFYNLAGAHARLDILGKMLHELDESIIEADRQQESGIEQDVSPRDLRQQRADLLKQAAFLRGAIAKLNGQLEGLLDLGSSSDQRLIRPTINWEIEFDTRDEDEVISSGIAQNSELSLLNELIFNVTSENSATLEGFLVSIQPLLALANEGPSSPCKFLLLLILSPKPSEETVQTRRNQLLVFRSGKERELTAKIQDAYHDMLAVQERLAFAKEEKRLAQERLNDMETKFRESLVGQLAVRKATLDVLRIDDTIVEKIVEWYVSRARLQHAEGTILECR